MFVDHLNVVGNAQSLFDKDYGALIDEYPTIRFNYIEKLNPEKQGTRWDYMATSNPREIKKWKNASQRNFHTHIYTKWDKKGEQTIGNAIIIPDNVWKELNSIYKNNTKARGPSSGLSVLFYLNELNLTSVNIFGFDWKKTMTYYNDIQKDKGENKFHDYEFENKYCLELIEKNGWKLY
jgi:hypothetical protein